MKTNNEHILFDPGNCLTRKAIELYIDGKLTEAQKKMVLHHVRKCELCADALEGSSYFLSAQHYGRTIDKMHNSPWRRSLDKPAKSKKLFMGISSIAASLALLFGLYYMFQMKHIFEQNASKSEMSALSEVHTERPDSYIIISDSALNESSVSRNNEEPGKQSKNSQVVGNHKADKEIIAMEELNVETEVVELAVEASLSSEKTKLEEPAEINTAVATQQEVTNGFFSDAKENEVKKNEKQGFKKRSVSFKKEEKSASKAYYVAEVMPMFNGGGVDNFNRYIADSLKVILPDSVWNQSIIVSFRITTSGKIDNVKLLSATASKQLNHRIVELVENSPEWVPAYISGNPVAVDEQIEIVLNQE